MCDPHTETSNMLQKYCPSVPVDIFLQNPCMSNQVEVKFAPGSFSCVFKFSNPFSELCNNKVLGLL